ARRGCKMSVTPPTFSAFCGEKTLLRLGKIVKQVNAFNIQNLRPYRHLYNYVRAIFTVTVRAFAVFAALGLMLGVVAEVQQCIQTFVRFEPHVTAASPGAARRPAARHKFFTPKSSDAVAAVTGFDLYFCTVDKHK